MSRISRSDLEQALQRMLSVAEHPRALAIRPHDRAALRQAGERVHAQMLGGADPVLTIALAGCTGAGKSTLINALAGAAIADISERRPCTTCTRVYHHRAVPGGGLPEDLAEQAAFVTHDRPQLRQKVLVDTPDLDTYYTEHRAATRALLKAAGLVIYVFSPERYVEERAWSVLRQEQRFSACLAVLNKADMVAPEVLPRIVGEIRERFAEMGKPDIPVLCISAIHHASPGGAARAASSPVSLDEFVTLRAYIEQELQAGDIARMIRRQRRQVLDHLQEQVARIVPADAVSKMQALEAAAGQAAGAVGQDLAERMQDPLLAMEADLSPLIVVRKHQRFWGPFRTWLSVWDFLRYGLPRLVRQLQLLTLPARDGSPGRLQAADRADAVQDRLRQAAQHLQTFCFENGLPVERWRSISGGVEGRQVLAAVARQVEDRFETLAAAAYRQGRALPWLISFIAWLMPAGLIVFGAYSLARQFAGGRPAGQGVMWDLLALLLLSYLLLHMLTGVLMSGRGLLARRGIGSQALDEVLKRMVDGWVKVYRDDLEADIADLREPLDLLGEAVDGPLARSQWPDAEAPDAQTPGETPTAEPPPPAGPVEADVGGRLAQDPAAQAPPQEPPQEPPQGLSAGDLLRQSMRTGRAGRGKRERGG